MNAPSRQGSAALITRLKEAAARIAQLEQDAQTALRQEKNEDAYRQRLREKALFLAGLPESLAPDLADAPSAARVLSEPALSRFARGAREALSLDSVFYMSALLYPDHHAPGEPNNLELLILDLEKSLR